MQLLDARRFVSVVCTVFVLIQPCWGEATTVEGGWQTARYFDIPAKPLHEGLIDLALQSGLTILIKEADLAGYRSSPLVGKYTPENALYSILLNAPFTFEYDDILNTIRIVEREISEPSPESLKDLKVAAQPETAEDVLVTGIRSSLLSAMDVKYNATGIVDAVAEEDIGKFPDSNLAESVQRLSGVSISYTNNEGDKIQVRGFDSEFNLVLLNGRQMPSADQRDGAVASTRAFNFADIASENVASLEVYKTNQANRPSGGIGSVVNIKTARPFDFNSNGVSVGAKAVSDTSNEVGSDITPELFGSTNYLNDEKTFGFVLSGAYQERDSRSEEASMLWQKREELVFPDGVIPPGWVADTQYWYPSDIEFVARDYHRERTNAQIALQFSSGDSLETTLDYTFSSLEVESESEEILTRFSGNLLTGDLTLQGDTVVRTDERGADYQFIKGKNHSANENHSLGLNMRYQASDTLHFIFDAHSSSSEYKPKGYGDQARIRILPLNAYSQHFDASYDIPSLSFVFSDNADGSDARAQPSLSDSLPVRRAFVQWKSVEATIDQVQLDGVWQSAADIWLDGLAFGFSNTRSSSVSRFGENRFFDVFENAEQPVDFYDVSVFQQRSNAQFLDQFSGGLDPGASYYSFDFENFVNATAEHLSVLDPQFFQFDDQYLSIDWANLGGPRDNPSNHNDISEVIDSVYGQLLFHGADGVLPYEILLGLRYERTGVESNSSYLAPASVRWVEPNGFWINATEAPRFSGKTAEYDVVLPSISARFSWRDSWVFRAAFSKSITRPKLNLLIAEQSITSVSAQGFYGSEEGNASLSPYTAKNYDLALEYYYSDASYVALSAFEKRVDGFPSNQIVMKPVLGLTDVYTGPRAEAIREELIAQGQEPSNENVFNLMIERYPPGPGESGVGGDENDPLLLWQAFVPTNSIATKAGGYELSWQHMLGETGFGSIINYTKVNSNAPFQLDVNGFDNSFPADQDFANLIAFYDKYGWQIRFALHWRDRIPTLTRTRSGVIPIVTESYQQLDGLISYDINDAFTVFLEGINLTNETQVTYSIDDSRLDSAGQYGSRYHLGFRCRF